VKTLPKNLIARLSRAGSSAAGRGSGGSALVGTVCTVQAMGMRKKQHTEGERERSPEQEYLCVNRQPDQEEESNLYRRADMRG
jgi:hypothetical protein